MWWLMWEINVIGHGWPAERHIARRIQPTTTTQCVKVHSHSTPDTKHIVPWKIAVSLQLVTMAIVAVWRQRMIAIISVGWDLRALASMQFHDWSADIVNKHTYVMQQAHFSAYETDKVTSAQWSINHAHNWNSPNMNFDTFRRARASFFSYRDIVWYTHIWYVLQLTDNYWRRHMGGDRTRNLHVQKSIYVYIWMCCMCMYMLITHILVDGSMNNILWPSSHFFRCWRCSGYIE